MSAIRFTFTIAVLLTLSTTTAFAQSAAKTIKASNGSLFTVGSAPSLGKLFVSKGQTIRFDTGTAKRAPTLSGVLSGKGVTGLSASGQVELAVYAFDQIDIQAGATVEVVGTRGLVLLASGPIAIASTLDLSGEEGKPMTRNPQKSWEDFAREDGQTVPEKADLKEYKAMRNQYWHLEHWSRTASGGPGGEGGEEGTSFNSAPPPLHAGAGAPAMKDGGLSGKGYGAGFSRRVRGGAAGSGAGYGGAGGESSLASSGMYNRQSGARPWPGGVVYGDEKLSDLFGGSGGGGGCNDRGVENGGGGGGGGALALISDKAITIGATGILDVSGGAGGTWEVCGGGGSGGAILLKAPEIKLDSDAKILAVGGNGGNNPETQTEIDSRARKEGDMIHGRLNKASGGGGGGGRVAFYGPDFNAKPAQVDVSGGKGGAEAKDGADGSFYSP